MSLFQIYYGKSIKVINVKVKGYIILWVGTQRIAKIVNLRHAKIFKYYDTIAILHCKYVTCNKPVQREDPKRQAPKKM